MKFAFLCLCLLTTSSWAQVITTIAGNGSSSYTGDGASATSAGIGFACGIVFDSSNNYFITELNNTVRKVTTCIISTYAGIGTSGYSGDSGPATAAALNSPIFIAVDNFNNLFFTDRNNNRIRKISASTGIISTFGGTGSIGFSGDGGAATSAFLNSPYGICIDHIGNIYFSDRGNNRIRKIDTFGIITTFAGTGTAGYSGDGGQATSANISNGVNGIRSDFLGDIYVCDGFRIRKITRSTGIINTIAGNGSVGCVGDGGPATGASFSLPHDVAVDNLGRVYVVEMSCYTIRMIDTGGIIYTVAGTGSATFSGDGGLATAAGISSPRGIAFDNCDNLYITDNGNKRIRKVTMPYAHTATTLSITSNTSDTVCTGMPVTYTAHSTATGTVAYQWQVNGSNVGSGGASYTYSPANGDNVKCVLINTMPCYTDTASSNTLHMVTRALAVMLSGATTAPIGTTVTVNATVTGADSAYSLQWRNRGLLFATTTVPTVSYTKAVAVDSITATVVSASQSCKDSAVSGVHIVAENVSVGNLQLAVGSPRVYPNPVDNVLHVEAVAEIDELIISNVLGQTVVNSRQQNGALSVVLDVSGLSSGVYFVKVNGVCTNRFVKR